MILKQSQKDFNIHLIVIYNKDFRIWCIKLLSGNTILTFFIFIIFQYIVSNNLIIQLFLFQIKIEVRTLPIGTFHFQTTAHQIQQTHGNRKSKTGTFNISVSAFIHTLKWIKQPSHIFFLNSDTCIFNWYIQLHRFFRHFLSWYSKCNFTLRRILDSICKDIGNNLSEPYFISMQMHRGIRFNF